MCEKLSALATKVNHIKKLIISYVPYYFAENVLFSGRI